MNGWGEGRNMFRAALMEAAEPDDANPFGPDPARAASIGRPDDGHYYAPAQDPFRPAEMPTRPLTAGGVNA